MKRLIQYIDKQMTSYLVKIYETNIITDDSNRDKG